MEDTALVPVNSTLTAIERELDQDPRLRSKHTKRNYLHDLVQFEAWRNGRPLTRGLVEHYASDLQKAGRATSGINRALAAVRWWARKVGDLTYESSELGPGEREEIITQAARVAGVKDLRGGDRPQAGRHVGYGEIGALLRACADDSAAAGVRDGAMIAIAAATGLRRAELIGLSLGDIEIDQANSEAVLTIRGKGGKVRKVEVTNGGYAALADWLAVRGTDAGPLFCWIRRGGHPQRGTGMTTEAAAQMLAKRAKQAGITKALRWHDLRRTLAGALLDNGNDVVIVQKILGHASPVTTARYDRRPDETRKKALRGHHVPYFGRGLV